MAGTVTQHKCEMRSVASLSPYANNSRTHSPKQIDQLISSIKKWGWTIPVLIDETGMIIAGHARVRAAKKIGIRDVPVIVAAGWSDEQKKAYVIADNRLSENAGWDDEILRSELSSLMDAGFDVGLTGFDGDDIDGLFDDGSALSVREVDTSVVADRFWISVRGPLRDQAEALLRLSKAMDGLDKVTVDIGTVEDDGP